MNQNILDLLIPNEILLGLIIITFSFSVSIYIYNLTEQTEINPGLNKIELIFQEIQNNYANNNIHKSIEYFRSHIGRDYFDEINPGNMYNDLEINNRIIELINSENIEFFNFILQWKIQAQNSLNFIDQILMYPNPYLENVIDQIPIYPNPHLENVINQIPIYNYFL